MWEIIQEMMHTRTGRTGLVLVPTAILAAIIYARAFLLRNKPAKPRARSSGAAPPPAAPKSAAEAAAAVAEAAGLAVVRRRAPNARAFHFGAVDLDPKHLAIWFVIDTDAERDGLKSDATLDADLRAAIAASGYPQGAVPDVGFAFESEETVNRDYRGDWRSVVQ